LRNTLRLGSGTPKEHWSVDARISKISADGYIDRATADMQSVFLTASWFSKNDRLKATMISGKERTYQAWDGVSSDVIDTNRTFNRNGLYFDANGQPMFYENEVDDYQQNHYLLSYAHQFGRNTALSLGLHHTHGEGYYEEYEEDKSPGDYIAQPHQIDTLPFVDFITQKWLDNDFSGLTASLNTGTDNLKLSAGMAYSFYKGNHFGRLIWSSGSFVEPTFNYEWYRNTGDKSDFNIFAKGTLSLNHGLTLLGDLQYRTIDYTINGIDDDLSYLDTRNQYRFFNPKAGISWQPANEHRFQLYTGIANREPGRSNFTDADAGKVPKPERLMNMEAGYNYTRTHFAASVNLYYMNYKDQLVLTGEINQVGAPVMVNIDKSYRAGIELGWGYQPTGFFDWKGNITLSRNKIPEYVSYVDNWDAGGQLQDTIRNADLSFSPNVIIGSTATIKPIKSLSIDLISKFAGKQYLDNTGSDNRKLDPYFVNNLRFTYSPKVPHTGSFSLYLQLNNILNEQYETNGWVYRYHYNGQDQKMDGLFPQAGLNFIGGIRISL
jgi:iron complex outermembrane receptor protein